MPLSGSRCISIWIHPLQETKRTKRNQRRNLTCEQEASSGRQSTGGRQDDDEEAEYPQAPEGGKAGRGQESSTTGPAYLCELCTSAMVRLVRQALRRASGEGLRGE